MGSIQRGKYRTMQTTLRMGGSVRENGWEEWERAETCLWELCQHFQNHL